jgi:ABC-type oligopeptide transport system substrate-binding subunit
LGWTPDFADPSNVLNPLLRGTSADDKNSENRAHFDDPAYNRRLDAARLTGPARYTTPRQAQAAPVIAAGSDSLP